jgi:hypothetical protein
MAAKKKKATRGRAGPVRPKAALRRSGGRAGGGSIYTRSDGERFVQQIVEKGAAKIGKRLRPEEARKIFREFDPGRQVAYYLNPADGPAPMEQAPVGPGTARQKSYPAAPIVLIACAPKQKPNG